MKAPISGAKYRLDSIDEAKEWSQFNKKDVIHFLKVMFFLQ